jgi:hypothetical protein
MSIERGVKFAMAWQEVNLWLRISRLGLGRDGQVVSVIMAASESEGSKPSGL